MSQRRIVGSVVLSFSLGCTSGDKTQGGASPTADGSGGPRADSSGAGASDGAGGGGPAVDGNGGQPATADGAGAERVAEADVVIAPDAGPDVSMTPTEQNSVLERNNHPSRDGHFVQPTLTRASAASMARDSSFVAAFAGTMWASPLYLENGPAGHGVFFAVTNGNDVYALDETTGAIVWTRNVGSAPASPGVPCGGISPIGIISTPVIDAVTRTIYVAGAVGTAVIERHEVHALSVDDGSERAGWPVDVATIGAGNLLFSAPTQNQRSALSLVGGVLYVAYGGHVGDCADFRGWVVAINTRDSTMRGAWATLGRGEGIWAAGGMASDGNGVFAVTGNNTLRETTHADSEEVVRITGLGMLNRTNANFYYPASWLTMDATDADFGAINPVYVTVPGARPASYVVALAKDGHMYLLDSTNLGGMGGHIVDFMVADGGAMAVRTVPTAYATSQGVHVAFAVETGALCPAGSPAGAVVMSVLIPAGSPPAPRVVWCAGLSGAVTSPITTTTDGRTDAIVWYMNNARLTGVDGDTGQTVFSGADSCPVNQWTSPIAVKGRLVVGGEGQLCSWSSR